MESESYLRVSLKLKEPIVDISPQGPKTKEIPKSYRPNFIISESLPGLGIEHCSSEVLIAFLELMYTKRCRKR